MPAPVPVGVVAVRSVVAVRAVPVKSRASYDYCSGPVAVPVAVTDVAVCEVAACKGDCDYDEYDCSY